MLTEELRGREVKQGKYFKAAKYAAAIRSIASHTAPITSGREAKVFPGVGESIASKIQEIIDTVQFSRVCYL